MGVTAARQTAPTIAWAVGAAWKMNVFVMSRGLAMTAQSSSVPMTATTVAGASMAPASVMRAMLGTTAVTCPVLATVAAMVCA